VADGKIRRINEGKQRIVYLEILRVIAIFGVLFCHTGSEGMHHYLETENRINYWLGVFLASVSQYCIPLFFMISGVLLLRREESISYVLRHRVFKIALVTVFVVLVQYYLNYRRNPAIGFDRKTYLRLLYEGTAAVPHWFLYSYISFLLVLPFLQRLVKIIPEKSWFLYVFLVWEVLNGLFPILEYYQEWGGSKLEMPMFGNVIVWAMLGYFVEYCSEDIFYKKDNLIFLTVVSAVLAAETMHMNDISIPVRQSAVYGGLFAPVYALLVFAVVRYLCYQYNMPAALEKFFCFAGAGVFGTYLMEGELRAFFHPVYVALNTRIYAYPAAFVWIGVCVAAGIVLSNLFRLIPVVGKLI